MKRCAILVYVKAMHKNGGLALFLVPRRVMRWKFIGRSDQKLLEIGRSNLPPILNTVGGCLSLTQ